MNTITAAPEQGIAPPSASRSQNAKNTWKSDLAPYARADVRKSVIDVLTSVVPYMALFYVMYLSLDVSYWLTLALSIPASGFLLRTYIVFHDCAHGNFLPSKRGNHILGVFTALLVYTPFSAWRHSHAMHHASAGDLDRRGDGDVPTMTVEEYQNASRGERIVYRLTRNAFVLLTLGPIVSLVIQPRLWKGTDRPRIKRSIIGTNIALVALVALMCVLMGPLNFFLVQFPMVMLAGGAGVWLFFVQHQFEDAYWENSETWSYAEAALQGSSYLRLPKVLQYFSGNIGLHHVHHLSAKVPNYHLQAAHDATPIFQKVPVLTLRAAVKSTRLKLWCPDRGRLVTWREAAEPPPSTPAAAGTPAASAA
ncbi:fatty acid desaturase [Patulibacter americanus]|uniref:fatty acid desaturase n=1 Tax=Patulibacter americanus TaxID=588672 RepID=UPI0003B42AFB|nr:fatty acid desaturase [Patulibacter americanus]